MKRTKLDMSKQPPHLREMGGEIVRLLCSLDEHDAPRLAAIATRAPWNVFDEPYFAEPSVFGLAAFGKCGIDALADMIDAAPQETSSGLWSAPVVILLIALNEPSVAASHLGTVVEFPGFDVGDEKALVARVRQVCGDPTLQAYAERRLVDSLARRAGDPVAFGNIVARCRRVFASRSQEVDRIAKAATASVNRVKEPFGVMWDGRHLEGDLADVSEVTIAFADMNGLKQINDVEGHAAGDSAIRRYLGAIQEAVGAGGICYRRGGDEVVISFPNATARAAREVVVIALEKLSDTSSGRRLTASCGLAERRLGEPVAQVLERADQAMYRAKELSKASAPRTSVVCIEDAAPTVLD